ncbi:TetR family transcriptional regulator [Pseudosulfitobacter sp. SM2401]|uniref:TetR/AcrR family transcriptional regulator n=1 Tax=Pseudosulfitobacter sp. SM2401 TaxID=3350098 RepID=UPI0036F30BE4
MTSQPGYRGLRQTSNREALLGAASELIGVRSLSEVSIDEIVHRAGVAKGTFYNHFRDKADISHHVAVGVRQDVQDQIAQFKSIIADPALRLSIALTLFLDLAVYSPQRAQILVTMLTDVSDIGAPMNARVRATLEEGRSSGRFSFRSLDSTFVFVLGIVVAGVRSILERDIQDDSPDLINDLIVHGLIGLGLSRVDAVSMAASARDKVRSASAPDN